uniref:Thymidine kinase n=1 Tax=candidate division WWE3 bacterium TaxID=2053526 RepID=A0A831YYR9_UNCKA
MGRKRRTGLFAFSGCMFAGKTDRLIQELEVRVNHARQKVQVFSPAVDTRSGPGRIVAKSGDGHDFPAQTVKSAADILALVDRDTDVVAIDEAQFFDAGLVEVCRKLMRRTEVFVAGLDTDFRGEPFGPMPAVLAIATRVEKLTAICVICGEDAHCTQRLVNGEPAHYNDPIVLPGGTAEGYEPRCLLHHKVRRG